MHDLSSENKKPVLPQSLHQRLELLCFPVALLDLWMAKQTTRIKKRLRSIFTMTWDRVWEYCHGEVHYLIHEWNNTKPKAPWLYMAKINSSSSYDVLCIYSCFSNFCDVCIGQWIHWSYIAAYHGLKFFAQKLSTMMCSPSIKVQLFPLLFPWSTFLQVKWRKHFSTETKNCVHTWHASGSSKGALFRSKIAGMLSLNKLNIENKETESWWLKFLYALSMSTCATVLQPHYSASVQQYTTKSLVYDMVTTVVELLLLLTILLQHFGWSDKPFPLFVPLREKKGYFLSWSCCIMHVKLVLVIFSTYQLIFFIEYASGGFSTKHSENECLMEKVKLHLNQNLHNNRALTMQKAYRHISNS